MFYYSYFKFTGTFTLADALGAVDPYALSAEHIVDRVLSAGYTPEIENPRTEPLSAPGPGFVVRRDERTFVVQISRDAREIVVEEVRSDEYDTVK